MNLSTHVAVGAAVGYATRNPILGFLAGYISHHVIDSIPHTDGGSLHVHVDNFSKDKRILIIVGFDLAIVVFLAIFLTRYLGPNVPMIVGAFGGALPDLIDNMPFWSTKIRKAFPAFHRMHEFFHYTIEEPQYLWVGVMTQVFLIGLSLYYLV